jgi:hypothetical protein
MGLWYVLLYLPYGVLRTYPVLPWGGTRGGSGIKLMSSNLYRIAAIVERRTSNVTETAGRPGNFKLELKRGPAPDPRSLDHVLVFWCFGVWERGK